MTHAPEMGQGRGALSTAATLVGAARRDFDVLDRRLVEHLTSAQRLWRGQGSTAFQSLGLAWTEKQRIIVRALDLFADSLRSTEGDNTATDESQSSAFARTRSRLG